MNSSSEGRDPRARGLTDGKALVVVVAAVLDAAVLAELAVDEVARAANGAGLFNAADDDDAAPVKGGVAPGTTLLTTA